jgi:hypothetical protein
MPKFVFAYHGGRKPESPQEGEKVMAEWRDWFAAMGAAVIDPGNPVGPSRTVRAKAVDSHGGANPLSGYSLVMADDLDAAVEMAKGCPILADGSVEVAEAIEIGM